MEDPKKIIEGIKHPEIDASLVELGMIKDIKVESKKVSLKVLFPFPFVPIKDMIIQSIRKPLENEGFEVDIEEGVMTDEERERFFKLEREKWRM